MNKKCERRTDVWAIYSGVQVFPNKSVPNQDFFFFTVELYESRFSYVAQFELLIFLFYVKK